MRQTGVGTVEEWSKGVKRGHLSTTKWIVDWGAIVVASLANRRTVTTEALENALQQINLGCTKSGFARKRSTHPDFYGPNITDGLYRTQLTESLQTGQAMGFDERGDILPTKPASITSPDIKLLPFLLGTKVAKYREEALVQLELAVENGTLLNWAHVKDHKDYLGKLIWEVHAHRAQPRIRTYTRTNAHRPTSPNPTRSNNTYAGTAA
jgi:hypothetical protein